MSEYLDVIIFIAVMWVLAGLKWWFFNKNHKEWKDTLAQSAMIGFCAVIVITAYIYQSNRTYPPYKGRDYDYYAREAKIKKQIDITEGG